MQWMPHHQTRTSWQCETSTHIKCFMKWQRSLPWTLWPFKFRLLRIYFVNILLNSLKYCLPLCHLPLRGQPFDFWWGYGWFGWEFFPKPLEPKCLFPRHITMWFFFSVQEIFSPRYFLARLFFPSKSVNRLFFFWNHSYPLPTSKVKRLAAA